jgi:hypothetical protein
MRFAIILAAAAGAVAAFAPAASATERPAAVSHVAAVQTVVLAIRPAPYANLMHVRWWDVKERRAPDERVIGGNFAVRPDVPVRVVVWNYTGMLHSFASDELGVNVAILPGSAAHPSKAVFTFVARKYGVIPWHCAVPCGGYMGGNVYAIVGE